MEKNKKKTKVWDTLEPSKKTIRQMEVRRMYIWFNSVLSLLKKDIARDVVKLLYQKYVCN